MQKFHSIHFDKYNSNINFVIWLSLIINLERYVQVDEDK